MLKIAQLRGSTMTTETFVEHFGIVLNDEQYFDALRALRMPLVKTTADYSEVAQAFNAEHCSVLLFSEVDLTTGSTTPNKHCSVLVRVDLDGFCIWTPRQDGGEDRINFSRDHWYVKQFSAAILAPGDVR